MADKMTLQRARDHVFIVVNSSHLPGWEKNREAWKVLDAHLAAMGEPVAWRITDGEGGFNYLEDPPSELAVSWAARWGRVHEPLYTAPPASGDWNKVREIIAEMRSGLQLPGENCATTYVRGWADQLTAALPENGK